MYQFTSWQSHVYVSKWQDGVSKAHMWTPQWYNCHTDSVTKTCVHQCLCLLLAACIQHVIFKQSLTRVGRVILTHWVLCSELSILSVCITGKHELDVSEWLQRSRGSRQEYTHGCFEDSTPKFQQDTCWVYWANSNTAHNFEVKNETHFVALFLL